jgi:hypothetical protein
VHRVWHVVSVAARAGGEKQPSGPGAAGARLPAGRDAPTLIACSPARCTFACVMRSLDFTTDNVYAGLAGRYYVRSCDSDLERKYMPNIK